MIIPNNVQSENVPNKVTHIATDHRYKDDIIIRILSNYQFDKNTETWLAMNVEDKHVYIQEKVLRLEEYKNLITGTKMGKNIRFQIEYFFNNTGLFVSLLDEKIKRIANTQLGKIDFANSNNLLDVTILRVEKNISAYWGTYEIFDEVIKFTAECLNLF